MVILVPDFKIIWLSNRTRCRLFQKSLVYTKLDLYIFIRPFENHRQYKRDYGQQKKNMLYNGYIFSNFRIGEVIAKSKYLNTYLLLKADDIILLHND